MQVSLAKLGAESGSASADNFEAKSHTEIYCKKANAACQEKGGLTFVSIQHLIYYSWTLLRVMSAEITARDDDSENTPYRMGGK